MAGDTKVTDLAAKSAPVAADLCMIVDLEDTSMAPTGTNKKSTFANIATSIATILGLKSASTKAASGAGATVASLAGATVVGHLATFTDTAGTIGDGGPIPTVPPIPPATVPAGATGQIQYNNAGAFGGSPALIVGAGNALTLADGVTITTTGGVGGITFNDSSGGYTFLFQRATSSSVLNYCFFFTTAVQQSGTGSYCGFIFNVTETSIGTGTKVHTQWAAGGAALYGLDRWCRPICAGTAPTTVNGPAAGTGGNSNATNGTDLCGLLAVNTGTAPAASGIVVTVTFNHPYSAVPKAIHIDPAGGSVAALSGQSMVWVDLADVTANGFSLRIGSVPLAASTNYRWWYKVHG